VAHHAERLDTWRRLLSAYDVDRQLERGYTLTLGDDGRIVRSAAALAPGAVLVTRFADGTAVSDVRRIETAPADAATGPAPTAGEEKT
jgi:exodeoxyribonuclease VII large subunit